MTKQEYIKLWANSEKREAFLADYRSWGVWLTVPELDLVYYKHELPSGTKIIVMEYQQIQYKQGYKDEQKYKTRTRMFLMEYEKFLPDEQSENNMTEYLLKLKLEYQEELKQEK